jgi:hypothetical protein
VGEIGLSLASWLHVIPDIEPSCSSSDTSGAAWAISGVGISKGNKYSIRLGFMFVSRTGSQTEDNPSP